MGALEGLKRMGAGIPDEHLSALATHPDPRVRAGASLAAFMGGQVSQTAVLTPMLKSSQEKDVLAAMNAMLEIGLLLPVVLQSTRFSKLAARLKVHRDSVAFRDHLVGEDEPLNVTALGQLRAVHHPPDGPAPD